METAKISETWPDDQVIVVDYSGNYPVFSGTEAKVVEWLEQNLSANPRWVYVSTTSDILTESEFLDLAS